MPLLGLAPLKQIDVAGRGGDISRQARRLGRSSSHRLGYGHVTLPRSSRHRPEMETATSFSPEIAADDPDALIAQEALCELPVFLADVGKALHHPGAAEYLGLEPLALSAVAHHAVDPQFHQVNAGALGFGPRLVPREEEVVHAADCRDRITDARADARTEKGRETHLRVRPALLV